MGGAAAKWPRAPAQGAEREVRTHGEPRRGSRGPGTSAGAGAAPQREPVVQRCPPTSSRLLPPSLPPPPPLGPGGVLVAAGPVDILRAAAAPGAAVSGCETAPVCVVRRACGDTGCMCICVCVCLRACGCAVRGGCAERVRRAGPAGRSAGPGAGRAGRRRTAYVVRGWAAAGG